MLTPPDSPPLVDDGLEILDEDECRSLLASQQVGRVVTATGGLPVAFPVNYVVIGGDIVFFTGEGTKLAAASRAATVTFQVDAFDLDRHTGWSVLAFGAVSLASAVLADRARDLGCWPFAAGVRHHAVRIRPDFLSGRRVVG